MLQVSHDLGEAGDPADRRSLRTHRRAWQADLIAVDARAPRGDASLSAPGVIHRLATTAGLLQREVRQ